MAGTVPAVVRMAQTVLDDIRDDVESERWRELQKQLPAKALEMQRAGEAVDAAALKALALGPREAFNRAAKTAALTLADLAQTFAREGEKADGPYGPAHDWLAAYGPIFMQQDVEALRARYNHRYGRLLPHVNIEQLNQLYEFLPERLDIEFVKLLAMERLVYRTDLMGRLMQEENRDVLLSLMRENRLNDHEILCAAAGCGDTAFIRALYAQNPDIIRNAPLIRAREEAIKGGHVETFDFLQSVAQMVPDATENFIDAAIAGGHLAFLERIFPPEKRTQDNFEKLLHKACREDNVAGVAWLRDAGVDLRAVAENMLPELLLKERKQVVGLLLAENILTPDMVVSAVMRVGDMIYHRHDDVKKIRDFIDECGFTSLLSKATAVTEDAALCDWQVESLRTAVEGRVGMKVFNYLLHGLLGAGQSSLYQCANHILFCRKYGDEAGAKTLARRLNERVVALDAIVAAIDDKALQQKYEDMPGKLVFALTHDVNRRATATEGIVFLIRTLPALPWSGLVPALIRDKAYEQKWYEVATIIDECGVGDLPDDYLREVSARAAAARRWRRALPEREVHAPLLACSPDSLPAECFCRTADFLSRTGIADNPGKADEAAYGLALLFRTEDRIARYLQKWGGTERRSLHKLVAGAQRAFPHGGTFKDIDAKKWGDAVLKYGPEMMGLLRYADKIPAPGATLQETRRMAAAHIFKGGAAYPELAAFCLQIERNQDSFDRAVKLIEKQKANPVVKNIPDITIAGEEFGMPGARFRRLADDDFRGLYLGKLVDCCQHIDHSSGARCAEHGFLSPEGGFYVVETADGEIIGQCWAWRGTKGEMVMDSLETKGERISKKQWTALTAVIAARIEAGGDITALLAGTDGERCPALGHPKAAVPARGRDHDGYPDSREQYMLWQSPGYDPGPAPERQGPPPPPPPQGLNPQPGAGNFYMQHAPLRPPPFPGPR